MKHDPPSQVDTSQYRNRLSVRNRTGRMVWGLVWLLFFRATPRPWHGWRRFLLRGFGAKIGKHCHVHASCRIWAPWNLVLEDYACLSHQVDCYSVDRVTIGAHATVSQYSFLCTASHDIASANMELTTAPIRIDAQAWVAARAFIGPGVRVCEGAVVGACAVVTKDVPAWTVVAGNPARHIKDRIIAADGGR